MAETNLKRAAICEIREKPLFLEDKTNPPTNKPLRKSTREFIIAQLHPDILREVDNLDDLTDARLTEEDLLEYACQNEYGSHHLCAEAIDQISTFERNLGQVSSALRVICDPDISTLLRLRGWTAIGNSRIRANYIFRNDVQYPRCEALFGGRIALQSYMPPSAVFDAVTQELALEESPWKG